MKSKREKAEPAEDPEVKARREVEEARAEADETAARQEALTRKTRRIMRIFGNRKSGIAGAAGGAGSSGGSGVVASRRSSPGVSGSGAFAPGIGDLDLTYEQYLTY